MTPMQPVQINIQKSQPSTDEQVEEFRAAQIKKARESTELDIQQMKAKGAEAAKTQNQSAAIVRLWPEGMAASRQHAEQNIHHTKR